MPGTALQNVARLLRLIPKQVARGALQIVKVLHGQTRQRNRRLLSNPVSVPIRVNRESLIQITIEPNGVPFDQYETPFCNELIRKTNSMILLMIMHYVLDLFPHLICNMSTSETMK